MRLNAFRQVQRVGRHSSEPARSPSVKPWQAEEGQAFLPRHAAHVLRVSAPIEPRGITSGEIGRKADAPDHRRDAGAVKIELAALGGRRPTHARTITAEKAGRCMPAADLLRPLCAARFGPGAIAARRASDHACARNWHRRSSGRVANRDPISPSARRSRLPRNGPSAAAWSTDRFGSLR